MHVEVVKQELGVGQVTLEAVKSKIALIRLIL